MMLIQSSLPSSVEAALSFISSHEKQDLLVNWMPGSETWQKCPKCDKHPHDVRGEALFTAEGEKDDKNSCSLNFPRCCSQLSTVSAMSESSTSTFVYQRRKPQGNSVAICPAQVSANMKPSDGCISAISSEAPSVAVKEHIMFPVETEAVRSPGMLPVECNSAALVSNSESFNGCSVGEEHGIEEAPRSNMHNILNFCCVNDSCSSSKSNMDLGSASLKTEVDDTGECSSSGALVIERLQDDLSEKNICISILRREGLLGGVWPTRVRASVEGTGISGDSCCSQSCKVCDLEETTLKMIICDNCEEAFHVSCCNPRIKKIPVDEWFCHPCLRKKRKILKGKNIKSLNLSSQIGRCRSTMYKGELGPIAFMLRDTEPSASSFRIGKEFQAEVPDWSGPLVDEVVPISEPLAMIPSVSISLHNSRSNKPSRLNSIGNWLQCREVVEGVGEGVDGTVCGKWRRAPLFEVQSDDWECFSSVLWDPAHADCAVPQELDTDEVLKQLKYIEMLRPRLAAKKRKLGQIKSVGSPDLEGDVRNTCTL